MPSTASTTSSPGTAPIVRSSGRPCPATRSDSSTLCRKRTQFARRRLLHAAGRRTRWSRAAYRLSPHGRAGSSPSTRSPAARRRIGCVLPTSPSRLRYLSASASARSSIWPGAVQYDDLYDLAYWLATATLYIGNDSGISHLAAAVGVPTIAIFQASDPRVWAPRGRAGVTVLESPPLDEVLATVRTQLQSR